MDLPDGDTVYKFCKKYGGRHGSVEPITNLYLDEREYRCLNDLPGITITKHRHRQTRGSLDVYDLRDGVLYVFEIEFASEAEARAYPAPPFAAREITNDDAFSGFALALRGLR
jgi:CYTH domain-containing protein